LLTKATNICRAVVEAAFSTDGVAVSYFEIPSGYAPEYSDITCGERCCFIPSLVDLIAAATA